MIRFDISLAWKPATISYLLIIQGWFIWFIALNKTGCHKKITK